MLSLETNYVESAMKKHLKRFFKKCNFKSENKIEFFCKQLEINNVKKS